MSSPENPNGDMPTPTPVASLTILVLSNGEVVVKGPVHDKIFCYGLLELARDSIKDYVPPAQPLIQPIRGNLPPSRS